MPDNKELLVSLLRDVNRSLGKYVKEVFATYNIPVSMMVCVRVIRAEPGITISQLARKTGIVKSHISNTIKDLEQRGWVEKKADVSDQRILRLHLTRPAIEQFELIGKDISNEINLLVSELSEEHALALIEGLQEIKAALNTAQERKSLTYCKDGEIKS
ncbi:MAG: MarR family winged helix-turn-helix transcriptional regulator [Chitinophagales bacterium]